MHARAGHFAGREQAGDGRVAGEIGFDAAHHVVRRRADRNAVAREVEADLPTHAGNQGESTMNELFRQVTERQVHRRVCAGGLARNPTGDTVPWCEVASRVVPGHERLARLVDEPRPFTP